MVDVLGLVDFFSRAFRTTDNNEDNYQSYDSFQLGSQTTSLDVLLQRARRTKNLSENKILDYLQVENDPNYGRGAVSSGGGGSSGGGFLGSLISKLGMSSSILTMITSQFHMAGITEFLPKSLSTLINNYTSLADASINLINNLQSEIIFKQITQALLNDLQLQFGNGTLTFEEIVFMAESVAQNLPLKEAIMNNGLRALFGLGLQNLLPESMVSILNAVQWIDQLDEIFGDDDTNRDAFEASLSNELQTYGQNKVEETIDVSVYEDTPITFNDPMGLVAQEQFINDLKTSYEEFIDTTVNEVAAPYDLTEEEIETIIGLLVEDANENIDAAFSGTIGLPSLGVITKAIANESHNKTVEAIERSFVLFTNSILDDLGLVEAPEGTKPFDYLVNLKKNIRSRIEMKRVGDTTENFTEINAYLQSVIKGGKITDAILEDLDTRIQELLKERNDIEK